MLQKIDQARLDEINALIEKHGIRFPVATFTKVTGKKSKGEASDYLKGNKPMSDNFYNTIIEHYEKSATVKDAPGLTVEMQVELVASSRVILSLLAEWMAAQLNRPSSELSSIYRKMVRDEAAQMIDELQRK